MQFYAIFGHFLPQAPRCASPGCAFTSQIVSFLYFTLLDRILATLEQSRLDFYPVAVCTSLACAPVQYPISVRQLSTTFSFLHWMSDSPGLPLLLWLPAPLYGPCLCCSRSMAPAPGPAPSHHARHAAPPVRSSTTSPLLQPPVRCTPFLLSSYLSSSRLPSTSGSSPSASCSSTSSACLGLGGVLRYKPFTGFLPVLPQYSTAQYIPL